MRALVQRVVEASVLVEGQEVGRIGPGLVVFLGFAGDDEIWLKKP
jgi:D-tyrosyl-tRNA(Tyr) deacylase